MRTGPYDVPARFSGSPSGSTGTRMRRCLTSTLVPAVATSAKGVPAATTSSTIGVTTSRATGRPGRIGGAHRRRTHPQARIARSREQRAPGDRSGIGRGTPRDPRAARATRPFARAADSRTSTSQRSAHRRTRSPIPPDRAPVLAPSCERRSDRASGAGQRPPPAAPECQITYLEPTEIVGGGVGRARHRQQHHGDGGDQDDPVVRKTCTSVVPMARRTRRNDSSARIIARHYRPTQGIVNVNRRQRPCGDHHSMSAPVDAPPEDAAG